MHRARDAERGLYETRATITPDGDYLLMFPDGGHYGQEDGKVNDMLAYRSSDKGRTWHGPTVAFDIDYNQHGFVPLIPRGSKRIYAFGTQPIWGIFSREHGLHENAWRNYNCSYADLFVDGDVLNLFLSHRWHQPIHLQMREAALAALPTRADL